jgi:hypothetical protein
MGSTMFVREETRWRDEVICQDYRALNAVTVKDRARAPDISDTIEAMAGCSKYSKIDLAVSFNQIRIWSPHLPKTAFITPFGLFDAAGDYKRYNGRLNWRHSFAVCGR